jgi:hypothetical protein
MSGQHHTPAALPTCYPLDRRLGVLVTSVMPTEQVTSHVIACTITVHRFIGLITALSLPHQLNRKTEPIRPYLRVAASIGQLAGHTHTHKHTCTVHTHTHTHANTHTHTQTSLNSIHAISVTDITSIQTKAVARFEESQTSQEAPQISAITPVCSADGVFYCCGTNQVTVVNSTAPHAITHN